VDPDPQLAQGRRIEHVWIGTLEEMFDENLSLRTIGFFNYVPKGEGMAMVQHLTANLEARKGYVAETEALHAAPV
jgi:hypothetical protein